MFAAVAQRGHCTAARLPLLARRKGQTEALGSTNVELGARIFYWARLVYIPVYMVGIPVARTGVWAISVVGMGMIFAAIVRALA